MIEPGVTIPIKKLQNMNFDHIRPQTSQTVINEFAKIVDDQDLKGIEKYGVTIDDAVDEDYHWLEMAGEEIADMMKYFVKQIQMLKKQNRELRFSQRKILLDKVLNENLELEKELHTAKSVVACLEARLNHGTR